MNRKGIFCFLLVLAFIALEIRFLNEATNASQRLQKAKALAFEAEKASFVRALMENSVDVAIEESLLQGKGKALCIQAVQGKQVDGINIV